MFVRKSTYDELRARFEASECARKHFFNEYQALRHKWNALVDRINTLGGESLFEQPQFTDDELRKMLMLCHPDKHNGKQMAVDITAKLNAIRKCNDRT